jgi:ABC-type uncharacterized transport system substrate-binding protein
MRFTAPLIAALFSPLTAAAHPHVVVQAQVTLVFNDAGDIAVRLDWAYDDLFSLLVTSDLGLDMDGDLVLTADEQRLLDTKITAWPPEYQGDLEVSQSGEILPLSEKQDHTMTYTDGLFREVHTRPVAARADPTAPLQIRVFDPSFYTAYDLLRPVTIEGRDDCAVDVIAADVDAAYALAAEMLDGEDPLSTDPDAYFPEIGDAFADTIVVTCAGQF